MRAPTSSAVARRNKNEERDIARGRVERLVALAEAALAAGRGERAARYGELAWRIKTTYQLRACAIDGRRCRACGAFFSAATRRVRVRDGIRITTCLSCGAVRRRPLAQVKPPSAEATRATMGPGRPGKRP